MASDRRSSTRSRTVVPSIGCATTPQRCGRALPTPPANDVVAALVRLVAMADLSAVEIDALAHDVAKCAGVGVRAVKSTLKAGLAAQQAQQAEAARERRKAMRSDPRPLQDRPALDAEWLPVLGALDAVASAVERVRRPRRDIDGTLARERRMPIAQTHAFTTANDEGDDA